MPIGGRPETLSQAARLKSEVEALRWASAVLRDTCERNHHIAARAREDARRIRGELFQVRLPRGPTCARVARRLVDTHLVTPNAEELADARTVVSELVSNAFVHGDGAIELRVALRRGRARIEVSDEGQDASIRLHSGDMPHGLHLVDALALVWGTRPGSTHVWAELPANRWSLG